MKAKLACSIAILACSLLIVVSPAAFAQSGTSSSGSSHNQGSEQAANEKNEAPPIPLDRAVTATAHQAWVLGGRTQDGFFDIVEELAGFSARNRGVTLPDNQQAGQRAGEWIRTQAMKDPNQLLYAIVDQAVQHEIANGTAKPIGNTPSGTPSAQKQ
jgi:hypothetical protein